MLYRSISLFLTKNGLHSTKPLIPTQVYLAMYAYTTILQIASAPADKQGSMWWEPPVPAHMHAGFYLEKYFWEEKVHKSAMSIIETHIV